MATVRELLGETYVSLNTTYFWDGEHADGDAPVGGDTTHYGWHRMMAGDDYRVYRGDALAAEHQYIEVAGTAWGDYCGSSYNRSNNIALLRDFPDTFVVLSMDFSTETLLLPLGAEISEDLAEILTGIFDDYPLYDEGHHSEVEQQMTEDCWEQYGEWDLKREIIQARGVDYELPEDFDLRELWWKACEDAGFYPYAEDANSMILWDRDVLALVVERAPEVASV